MSIIRIIDWEPRPPYWLTDQPREPNPGPCPCGEIELPTRSTIRLNAIDDYGNFCTIGFGLEDFEKFIQKAKTAKMQADQRQAARNFRYSKMLFRT
jgi:hypothetical protein